jgi:hypothetical protein
MELDVVLIGSAATGAALMEALRHALVARGLRVVLSCATDELDRSLATDGKVIYISTPLFVLHAESLTKYTRVHENECDCYGRSCRALVVLTEGTMCDPAALEAIRHAPPLRRQRHPHATPSIPLVILH